MFASYVGSAAATEAGRCMGCAPGSSGIGGGPVDRGLQLVYQSQGRVEELLQELKEAQVSAKKEFLGVQRRLEGIERTCTIIVSSGSDDVIGGRCGEVAAARRGRKLKTAPLRSASQEVASRPPGEGTDSMPNQAVDINGIMNEAGGTALFSEREVFRSISSGSDEQKGGEKLSMAPGVLADDGDKLSDTIAHRLGGMRRRLSSSLAVGVDLQGPCRRVAQSGHFDESSLASVSAEPRSRFKRLQDPNNSVHVPWNIFGLCILMADLTLTPCILAWDIPYDVCLSAFAYFTAVYWLLDIMANFCIGYYDDAVLVTNFRKIARRYMKTSFGPDCIIVGLDWLSMLILLVSETAGAKGVRLLRFLKLGRLMRVMNLLRVLRYMRMLSRLTERVLSERVRLLFAVASMSLFTLWFTHLVACIWFAIGRQGLFEADMHWTDDYLGTPFEEYAASFHWALAQITLGSVDIVCQNWVERSFNVVCLLIGLIVGTTLISTFSATMVEVSMANKDRHMKLRTLRQYLQENMIKGSMSLLVQQQVSDRMEERRRLVEAQVPALEMLSSSLRHELRFEIVRPFLLKHQLFSYLSTVEFRWCTAFCKTAFSVEALSNKDDLFLAGAPAKAAYILMRGSLSYILSNEEGPLPRGRCSITFTYMFESDAKLHSVMPQDWLADASLWAEWVHVGRAVASETSQVMVITPGDFERSLRQFPSIFAVAGDYGKQFHRRILDSLGQQDGQPPSDLSIPLTEWDDIVLSMSEQVQQSISHASVDVMDIKVKQMSMRASNKTTSSYDEIRREIDAGKCIMVLNKAGVPERIVSVVALQVSREDGCFLAQVGKWDPELGGLVPACELPGIKREASELKADTLRRLLTTKLKPLAGSTRIMRTERLVITKSSRRHQVQTKYLRYVFYCDLLEHFQAASATAKKPQWGRWDRARSGDHSGDHSDDTRGGISGDSAEGAQRARNHSELGIGWCSPMMTSHSQESECSRTMAKESTSFRSFFGASQSRRDTADIAQELLSRSVFFFPHEARGAFYAWLSPQEFEYLSSPAGDTILSEWLCALGQPPLAQVTPLVEDLHACTDDDELSL